MKCDEAFLPLNATKDIVVDFRSKSSKHPSQTFIKRSWCWIDWTEYLEIVIDSDLKFNAKFFIESVLTYSMIAWHGNLKVID